MKDTANKDSNLVKLRTEMGLTQKALADALGVSEQTVRNWERGKSTPTLTIPQIKALCALLKLPIEAIPDSFGPPTVEAERL